MLQLNPIDASTRDGCAAALRQHQLLYPDEGVVRFLARRFPASAGNEARHALDIGFGSGRHMKLLMDYGFHTWGIDYTEEAVQIARAQFAGHPLLREVILGDFRQHQFPVRFDVVVAWGLLFLTPPSQIPGNLRGMARLLGEEGRIFLNFRTRENHLYGLGREIEPDCFLLDERAGPYQGICYTFMDRPEVEALAAQAGLEIASMEKTTLSKNNLAELHSWLQVEFRRA